MEDPFHMKKGCFIVFFVCLYGYSQVENLPDSNSSGNLGLDITTFAYPMFLDGEQHSFFLINYKISEKLEADLQGFYDMYRLSNRFRTSLTLKRYLTERFYVFSGIEAEMADNKGLLAPLPPRIGAVMGFGYDVTDHFLIEGKFNGQLNNSPMGAYGEPFVKMPRVYTIGGKVKF